MLIESSSRSKPNSELGVAPNFPPDTRCSHRSWLSGTATASMMVSSTSTSGAIETKHDRSLGSGMVTGSVSGSVSATFGYVSATSATDWSKKASEWGDPAYSIASDSATKGDPTACNGSDSPTGVTRSTRLVSGLGIGGATSTVETGSSIKKTTSSA